MSTVKYVVRHKDPQNQYVTLEASFPTNGQGIMQLQLPSWRPGRYELGDFAKNVRDWKVTGHTGKELPFKKLTKDLWEFETNGLESINITYLYFAVDLNAGSTYIDHDILYFNPVNCFFYDPTQVDLAYEVSLDIPKSWNVATGLQKAGNILFAEDMQEIMDSPVICSNKISSFTYTCQEVDFHIEWYGNPNKDQKEWKADFVAFTEAQLNAFGDIPCKSYHFLILFHPTRAYHGVEHSNSTVISIGPEGSMADRLVYSDLLGVSCHELYHTWNIKNIRPAEMMPYDFSKANYSELGYVAEGVTTYFGDQYLHRSGVFSDEEYMAELSKLIQKHRDNEGRFHYSVAESSWDTWLDGYAAGATGRKVSIYTEGALIALICDVRVIIATNGKRSLDDVMKHMYEAFGKKSIGYTKADYMQALESTSGVSFSEIYEQLIHGRRDYGDYLQKTFDTLGLELSTLPNTHSLTHKFGLKLIENMGSWVVVAVALESPAWNAGLTNNDIIKSINGQETISLEDSLKEAVKVEWIRREQSHSATLKADEKSYWPAYQVKKSSNPSKSQKEKYDIWKNRP